MAELIDHAARERFVRQVDQPFSVIAPAGVGKTHAIIERVAGVLTHTSDDVALVTYTKKAAEQMRERLEARLRKDRVRVSNERIFIGTIHALCMELMDRHAPRWNLPPKREVMSSAEEAWALYLEEVPNPLQSESADVRECYLKYFGGFDYDLLLNVQETDVEIKFSPPPAFSFQKLFQSKFKGSVAKTHERLVKWANEFLELSQRSGFVMMELPKPPDVDSDVFPLYDEIFKEFIDWRATQGMFYARKLAQNFRNWRHTRGIYLYDDLIEIVFEKSDSDGKLSVVLDEAQDTSATQLLLLKKLAVEKQGKLQLTMVGDPQQSIYASRASLPEYLKMHHELIERCGAHELTFQVTFRCAQKIVDWANHVGPALLPGGGSQATFVELFAKPDASAGSVSRMELKPPAFDEDISSEERDWWVAQVFAQKLKALAPNSAALHHIAILAPRREWLFKLSEKLTAEGFRVQVHAQANTYTPAERLMRSLVHIFANPFDAFELVGLLREITAVEDVTLARIAQRTPQLLTLLTPPDKAQMPADLFEALGELYLARQKSKSLPLCQAFATFISAARIDEKVASIDIAHGGTLWPAWQQEKIRALSMAIPGRTAAELIRCLQDESADAPIEPGALQLMTMHKSKGLEWSAVFLPFLHRPLNLRPPSYPAVDPAHKTTRLSWKISTQETSAAEYENTSRLLYVALTRAKENLILVDDAAFYEEGISPARLMNIQAGGAFHADFKNLPTDIELSLPRDEIFAAPMPTADIWAGRTHFLPVITPSSLVHAGEPLEVLPTGADAQGGLNYGEAWHVMWHRTILRLDGRGLEAVLAEEVKGPFAARMREELEILKKTPLWKLLNNPQNKKVSEVPFAIRMDNAVMEGRIDLMIYEGERIWVIDWKTDHLSPENLFALYGAQTQAYQKAVHQLLGQDVEAHLYSTVHGAWTGPSA